MHRKLVPIAVLFLAAAAPAQADPARTAAATQEFLAALTALENSIHHYRDVVKEVSLLPQDVDPICAMMTPGAQEESNDEISLPELLERAKTTQDKAKKVCQALADERGFVDKARLANIAAARECATDRIPACDTVNQVIEAQARARAAEAAATAP